MEEVMIGFTPEEFDEISAFWDQIETETVQEAIMKAIREASDLWTMRKNATGE